MGMTVVQVRVPTEGLLATAAGHLSDILACPETVLSKYPGQMVALGMG
jgi:hypothetical protein